MIPHNTCKTYKKLIGVTAAAILKIRKKLLLMARGYNVVINVNKYLSIERNED